MKRFPGHLVASDPSNVGFWALQFISGPSSRPPEAHLDPWKAAGEFLNPPKMRRKSFPSEFHEKMSRPSGCF